jgi:O-antigen/teichoic acid export membrane protein
MKARVYAAVRWTTIGMAGRAIIQVAQVVVLARILVPADFGLVAIVLAAVGFTQVFADLGVSNAIVHRQDISDEQLSSLYWLNVLTGALLTLALFVASPFIAGVLRQPGVEPLLRAASLAFVVTALGQQLRVTAEKALEFAVVARLELLAAGVGFAVSIAWALAWPGPAALVAGLLGSTSTMAALCWATLAHGWRPRWRLRLSEIREFLAYGGYALGGNVLTTFLYHADVLVGARMLTPAALGLFTLPRDLSLRVAGLVNPIATRVALPTMALVQHDRARLKSIYLKTVWMTASINFPIYLALSAFAPEIVLTLFGSRWIESAPVLRLLAAWGMIRSIGNPVGALLFSTGRVDLGFKWNLAMLIAIPLAAWIGAHFGPAGIALAALIVQSLSFVPGWLYLVRPLCGASFVEYVRSMQGPFLTSVAATALAWLAVSWADQPLVRLVVGMAAGGVSYVALARVLNPAWLPEIAQILRARAPAAETR